MCKSFCPKQHPWSQFWDFYGFWNWIRITLISFPTKVATKCWKLSKSHNEVWSENKGNTIQASTGVSNVQMVTFILYMQSRRPWEPAPFPVLSVHPQTDPTAHTHALRSDGTTHFFLLWKWREFMRSGSAIDYGKTSDQLRISSRSLPNPDLPLFVQYRNLFFHLNRLQEK